MGQLARLGAGWALRSAVAFAIWLALDDTTQAPELYAGLVCAALAGALATAVRGHRDVRARVRPSFLRRLPVPFLLLVTESVKVTGALVGALAGRPPRSRLRAVRWRAGGDAPEDVGRRALVELLGTMGPNRIVLGVDRDRDALLVHELVPGDAPLDPLGLG